MLVDGSEPDPLEAPGTLGVLWLPSTPVGDGRVDWAALDGEAGGMGDTDEPVEVGATPVDDAVAVVGGAAVGEALEVDWETLEVDAVAAGLRAIDPLDDAATTAMPSTRTPATARIGTRANRLPSGSGSRQFGQNPETGVVT